MKRTKHILLFSESTCKYLVGTKHVTVFIPTDENNWIMYSPIANSNISIYYVTDAALQRLLHDKTFDYIEYDYDPRQSKVNIGQPIFLSCVNLVKFYFDINELSIFTAEELRDYMEGKKIPLHKRLIAPFRFIYNYIRLLILRLFNA